MMDYADTVMIPDLSPIFTQYETLRAEVDQIFSKMQDNFPDCVCCTKGCSDCCHALFDLSLVEAMYINRAFKAAFDYGATRSDILTKAATIDRKLTKLKRDLFRLEKEGTAQESILTKAAELRMPCPLLDQNNACLLYDARPITCRLYGIPTVIGQKGHVCGFSKFNLGTSYPTVQLDKIQARLENLSKLIATTVGSRFTELHQVYVPLSMALLTDYSESYLGIGPVREEA